jgi:hypothetical protein
MARAVRYHPGFDADVLDAAQWYDDRSAHLGSDFVARVRKATAELIADPALLIGADFPLDEAAEAELLTRL